MYAHYEQPNFVMELKGYAKVKAPQWATEMASSGQRVTWKNRGYTYETRREGHCSFDEEPYTEPYTISSVLDCPEGTSMIGMDPWMYRVVKTGEAKGLLEAMGRALKAEEVEVPE